MLRNRTTASEMMAIYEPQLVAAAASIPSGATTFSDIPISEPSAVPIPVPATESAVDTADRQTILEAIIKMSEYLLTHPKMVEREPVIRIAEPIMVRHANQILEMLQLYPELRMGVSVDGTDVLNAIADVAAHMLAYPEMARTEGRVEDMAMLDLVVEMVGLLEEHPAAGTLALSGEVLELVKRKTAVVEASEEGATSTAATDLEAEKLERQVISSGH